MTPEQRFRAARWGYVAVVLLATLTQLHFSSDLTAAGERLVRAFTPSLGWRDANDGLRNTVLFAGLGAVWVVSSRCGNVRAEIRRATLVGLALSATVEGLQVFSPVRTASIVDVTTNTLGALLGAGGVALLIAAVVAAKGARSYLGVPIFLLAAAYGGAVLCEALTPLFGPAALPWIAGGPVGRLNAALAAAGPISFDSLPLVDLLLFAPAGFLFVMLLRERGREAGWVGVAGAGAGLALLAELGHGPARHRRAARPREPGAAGIARRAGRRVQRAARAPAVPLIPAARHPVGRLAAAYQGTLGAPVARGVVGGGDRAGTRGDRGA